MFLGFLVPQLFFIHVKSFLQYASCLLGRKGMYHPSSTDVMLVGLELTRAMDITRDHNTCAHQNDNFFLAYLSVQMKSIVL